MKGKIIMQIKSNLNRILSLLEKSRKEDIELKPIANNKFIYALSVDGECICFNAQLNQSSTNRFMETNPIENESKKIEEERIIEKEVTAFDFIVVNNGQNEYPVILLNEDMGQTKTSYTLIRKEENDIILGVQIKPIFYDKEENELIIIQSSLKIAKNDIFSENEICAGRKMIILKDGRKLIANTFI